MTRKEFENKIIGILESQFKWYPEPITSELKLQEDLCSDSLDEIEIIIELEEVFDIKIDDLAMNRSGFSVQDLFNLIENLLLEQLGEIVENG